MLYTPKWEYIDWSLGHVSLTLAMSLIPCYSEKAMPKKEDRRDTPTSVGIHQ